MDLSRRHDGGIGIAGLADRYDKSVTEDKIAWGNYLALTYTIPRKTLQLYGAPKSPHAKPFQLPVRPWGNATDDIFQSPEPVRHPTISMQDMLVEKGGFGEEEDTSTEVDEDEETTAEEESAENQDSYEDQQAKPWHCGYIVYERVK